MEGRANCPPFLPTSIAGRENRLSGLLAGIGRCINAPAMESSGATAPPVHRTDRSFSKTLCKILSGGTYKLMDRNEHFTLPEQLKKFTSQADMPNRKSDICKQIRKVLLAVAVGWMCCHLNDRLHAQAASPADLSPDLQEIVTLSRQHMDDSVITNYILSTGKSYKLSADDIIYLNGQGVSQGVLSALLRTSVSSTATAAAATNDSPAMASDTNAPAAPGASGAAPVPPPLDASAPTSPNTESSSSAPPSAPTVSLPTPTPMPVPAPAPAGIQDNFYADAGLNPSLWTTQSGVLSALGSASGSQILPTLAFSPSGMQMSGVGAPGEFMGVQSTMSFVPPFTFSTTVSGMIQSGIPFEIYLVSSDLQQYLTIAGHLGGRAEERTRVHIGFGPFGFATGGRPVNTPDYGFWINHTGSGLPVSSLGYRFADNPVAGIPYTIQISAGADGAASVTLLDASGFALASQSVPVGMGPFYVVLAGRNGPAYANWQSVQLTPATPPVVEQEAAPAPAIPPTPTLDYFQSQLAPYGNWINVPGYGLCWEPAVDPGWRPYYDGGSWEYTDAGWYWQSDYPWGDIVFHYGRWEYASLAGGPGWIWVPGFDYAPSWVVWRHDDADGYVGWAPLPPGAVFVDGGWEYNHVRVGADFSFGLGAGFFTYVGYDHLFFDPHVYPHGYRAFIVPHDRLALIYHHSVIVNHYAFDHGHFVNEGLPRDRMAALTHHDIRPVAIADMRHQEEIHNAVVRRDDMNGFKPGVSRPDAFRPGNSWDANRSNQQRPQPGHGPGPGQGQNNQGHGNDNQGHGNGNQQWH